MFQSTYLYKVRLIVCLWRRGISNSFNPRTYIRYDTNNVTDEAGKMGFNPRTYIRYDELQTLFVP